jgi:hypothetical protein
MSTDMGPVPAFETLTKALPELSPGTNLTALHLLGALEDVLTYGQQFDPHSIWVLCTIKRIVYFSKRQPDAA